jgi:hypothetical protein
LQTGKQRATLAAEFLRKEVSPVPRRRRERRARTHDWQAIQQQTLWPEQEQYERLRPIVLFGETAASRAKETGVSERTLHYQADQFERFGMVSLFPKAPALAADPGQRLPPELLQLIVDLKAEHPAFRPHEIARICYVRFGRKPSDHVNVKSIVSHALLAKLSHLLSNSSVRTVRPAFVSSAESESSRLPSAARDSDARVDLRVRRSFVHCQRPGSIGQRRDWR